MLVMPALWGRSRIRSSKSLYSELHTCLYPCLGLQSSSSFFSNKKLFFWKLICIGLGPWPALEDIYPEDTCTFDLDVIHQSTLHGFLTSGAWCRVLPDTLKENWRWCQKAPVPSTPTFVYHLWLVPNVSCCGDGGIIQQQSAEVIGDPVS